MGDSKQLALLESRLEIEEDSLDRELIDQPALFHSVSREYVLAVSRRDQAKDDLARLDAQLSIEHRGKLLVAEIRVTEAVVQASVISDPIRQEAQKILLKMQEDVGILGSLKEAYAQRSWMLRELCGLFVAGYFTQNSAKGPARDEVVDQSLRRRRQVTRDWQQD